MRPRRAGRLSYGGRVSQPSPSAYRFDAQPLVDPVDRAAVKAWQAQQRANGVGTGQGCLVAVMIAFASVFLVVGLAMLPLIGGAFSGDRPSPAFVLVPLLFLAVPIIMIVVVVRGAIGSPEAAYRLDHFARANGMRYLPRAEDPRLPGMIFNRGNSRQATGRVRGEHPRFVEFGNYRYTTGSGKNRTTHRWGYVAIHLDAPLPHIVLDALGNNSVFGSSLPTTFDRDQRLSLEGDFDRHFALYCPQGYERDALYLFTPDIMARFIDHAGQLDVEIVDDWLFLYTRRNVSTLDPRTWAWLFSVVAALMDKLAQWGRWRDERLTAGAAPAAAVAPGGALPFGDEAVVAPPAPAPGVAEPGRRLKKGWSWASVVVALLAIAWFALNVIGIFGR